MSSNWATLSLLAVVLFAAGLASASSQKSAQKSSSAELQSTSSSTAKKSKHTRHSSRRHHRRSASWRRHAQKGIDSERTREIQTALIREKYFHGPVTGAWDRATTEAMKRYQQDHGWQIKTVPDARALIELGLGPSNEHLLNPESAMTTRRQNAAAGVAGRNRPAGAAELPQ